jgi:hypothetical protein
MPIVHQLLNVFPARTHPFEPRARNGGERIRFVQPLLDEGVAFTRA